MQYFFRWLVENEPLIDPERTSIWGWSYGGYATAKVCEHFKINPFFMNIKFKKIKTLWLVLFV